MWWIRCHFSACGGFKGAVSVIENVVYAHDSERKWIQNHPVILYEAYILQHLMELLKAKLDAKEKQLFSAESLGREGQRFQDATVIRLLSDDDIIHMAKRYYTENNMVSEYFERRERRRPLWKSEAEYKAFFQDYISGKVLTALESAMETTAKYLSKSASNWVINKALIAVLKNDLDELAKANLDARTKQAADRIQYSGPLFIYPNFLLSATASSSQRLFFGLDA